uniref:SCP domain-containing protein n=1 Tax=Syphacia muris TaxID=451379 RepID=A0A0N5AYA1_9BILA
FFCTSTDAEEFCLQNASSSLPPEHHCDDELDKHMLQIITDVKYVKKRPKFVAVGEVNFQRECLDAHNAVRSKFGSRKLVWCQELADLAHTWAVKLADKGRILYPELVGIGENIHLSLGDQHQHLPSGEEITDLWANEAENFDFDNPRWHPNIQHFTQMIWKDTYEMGVARYWNTVKNCVAVVAFYRSPANVPSKRQSDEARLLKTARPISNDCIKRSITFSDPEAMK